MERKNFPLSKAVKTAIERTYPLLFSTPISHRQLYIMRILVMGETATERD